MTDTTIKKIDSAHSPSGPSGQKYLASGVGVAMRMWEKKSPDKDESPHRNSYETVGYVLSGRAELHSQGQTIVLEPGDSWLVPRDAEHRYRILEPFTAVEATHPPAHAQGRDS
ncbi:MAG: cupin domain-containing protein [Longimicrobiales bacterium]